MTDERLRADLAEIEVEVERRKKATPFEAYAHWAMMARIAALARYDERASNSADGGRG